MPRQVYQFGIFRLDTEDRLLLRENTPVPLPKKVTETLIHLIRNAGHVVGKEDLMKAVWPDTFVEEASLAQNISTLRKALGESADEHAYIETLPKRGYRFVAPVRLVEEKVVDAGRRKRIGVLALVVALAVLIVLQQRLREPEAVAQTPAAVRSIAVLPFTFIGAGADEYLGLGMADVLITKLANIRQITVRPTSAVRRFARTEGDSSALVRAGRELGVDSILEGNIQRSGDRIRVTVQLVRVAGGVPLWTGTFDEKFTDIFAVEDSISEQVARALALRLTSEEKRRISRRETENVEAFQEYLKGRFHWNKRTEEGLKKAVVHFNAAIEKDPLFALAYSGLADSYNLFNNYDLYSAIESGPRAKAAALKALELDGDLAEAHTSLALVQEVFDFDQVAADRSYRRALELNPNYSTAHHWYGLFLVQMGRSEESFEQLKRARDLDPLSLIIQVGVAWAYYFARHYDRAIELSRQTLDLQSDFWPAHLVLGWALEQKQKYPEALAELEKARELSGDSSLPLASLGHLHAVSGDRAAAAKVLQKLEERSKTRYVSPFFRAAIHAGLGDREQALAWLERAHRERAYWLISIKVNPWFDPLRNDPRFHEMERRVGFAEFAQSSR